MFSLSKIEKLDLYIAKLPLPLTIEAIFIAVEQTYHISLHKLPGLVPSSKKQFATYLASIDHNHLTSSQLSEQINQLYGVNLQALSNLEHAAISIYSKGQWILRHPTNYIELYTDINDIEVVIMPSSYYIEQTGSNQLPPALIKGLLSLGYRLYEADEVISFYNDAITQINTQYCYYVDPTLKPVPDAFKGKTMQHINHVIHPLMRS
ncbi:hypothetical protein ACFSTH_14040 [Paenibacillus yanchengensis]|uniref:Uncharacterized protein n=1 Tax=Paenibacillus yanchengensis TaxID=2035833 RepID=A0ABW4YNE4_9BACL